MGNILKKPLQSLYFQVLTGIGLGILLGVFYPSIATDMKPLGDGFIKLIKMLIAPVIFCTVVSGIAGVSSMKAVGKTGGYALLYFELLSTSALIVGLIMVNWLKPGVGMNVDPSQIDANDIALYVHPAKVETITTFFMNIIPNTFVDAFAKGEVLQILLVAILCGFSLNSIGKKGQLVLDLINQSSHVLFGTIRIIMKVAPIGAFGAIAFTIGKYGLHSLNSLGQLMGVFYLTCLIFIFLVLGPIAFFHRFNLWKLIKYIKEELVIVISTSSSESVLPRLIAKMENLGVSQSVTGLVIPAGYSFNLDGTSIYLTLAIVFIAQATNTPLDLIQQISLLVVLLITSKGAAGVSGSGFIVLSATLSSTGLVPVEGLALIFGIDRFMSEARALTNVIGNSVATIVVGKWCGEVDNKQLQTHLNPKTRSERCLSRELSRLI
jgi:aerobic C4-dicarboxylate transport protein